MMTDRRTKLPVELSLCAYKSITTNVARDFFVKIDQPTDKVIHNIVKLQDRSTHLCHPLCQGNPHGQADLGLVAQRVNLGPRLLKLAENLQLIDMKKDGYR